MPDAPHILVTGGTGFVGRAIVRELIYRGHRTSVLTRDTASRNAAELSAIGAQMVVCPSANDISAAIRPLSLTHVLHAAAPGVKPEDRTWERMNAGCTIYTLQLLEAVKDKGLTRFLNVGSWSEYAPPIDPDTPITEKYSLESGNVYGAAKASAFLSGQAFSIQNGIPFLSTRLFNIYGPGEAQTRLIPYVITQLMKNESVDLTPGLQERDFVFISDAAAALCDMLLTDKTLDHSVYNVCSGVGTSVRKMVEIAADTLKADKALLNFGARPYRPDEPLRVTGSPDRLASTMGWSARTPVEDGVRALTHDLVRLIGR